MAGFDDIKNYPPESLGDEKIMIPSLSVWNRCLLYVYLLFFMDTGTNTLRYSLVIDFLLK